MNNLNTTIDNIITDGEVTQANLTELNLYYVACSRCRLEIHNAIHLEEK